MLKQWLLSCAAMVAVVPAGRAQDQWLGRPAIPADSMPQSVLEAEAAGRRHPRATVNNEGPTATPSAIDRAAGRRCVIADSDAVRSGDFLAGPFASYNAIWRQGYGKLWWHPSEMTPQAPMLIIRATRLDQEAAGRVFEASDIAWPSGPRESAATSVKFYPTGVRLPSVGRWMLVATAGNNWGCFILMVH